MLLHRTQKVAAAKRTRKNTKRPVQAKYFSDNSANDGNRTEIVFHIRDVSKIYKMGEVEVHALRKINLKLYKGELAVLLGASGSGKSTLLNIIGGLDTPTSGEVIFRDHNLTAAADAGLTEYRRDHVGFVFQFYNLIPSLTALSSKSPPPFHCPNLL